MIGRLFGRSAPAPTGPDGDDALGALLVRVARSDGEYAADEAACIRAILAARYGADGLDDRVARAEALDDATGDTVHLTRAIKDVLPIDDRPAYLQDLWRVVLADAQRDHEEDGLLRLISGLLGLADRDSAFARQAVQNQAG